MILHFDRDGNPISLEEWAALYEQPEYRQIAKTHVGAVEVSTVWLGLNHNWDLQGEPLIFETMVFGGPLDQEQWRYSTQAQALAGHEHVVALVRMETTL